MTTPLQVDVRCALCGHVSSVWTIGSTSACGSPDLDLRPPGPMRSTLFARVQECAHCRYCAPSIAAADGIDSRDLQTPEYRALVEGGLPELASRFLRWSLVA